MVLGDEDTIEEWLEGYISFNNSIDPNISNQLRMTRIQYFKTYFPKDYDYRIQWKQLQRIKNELRQNDVIRKYCSDHNKYFRLNEVCPICT